MGMYFGPHYAPHAHIALIATYIQPNVEWNSCIPSLSSRIVTVAMLDPSMTSLELAVVTVTVKVSLSSCVSSPLMLIEVKTDILVQWSG